MTVPEWISLPFLGERDYLHGTTLFSHLRQRVPADAEICFRILHVMRGNHVRVWDGADARAPANPGARLDWLRPGKDHGTLLVEADDEVRGLARASYDEAGVIANADRAGRTFRLKGDPLYGGVASAVPLFKAMLKAEGLTPTSGGQWMFTRLDACRVDDSFERFALTLQLARPRLVAKSALHLDDEWFGDMYFSWIAA